MTEIIETILNIALTIFTIYGIYVLTKWKKAAQKLSKVCDEMHEELHLTKEEAEAKLKELG